MLFSVRTFVGNMARKAQEWLERQALASHTTADWIDDWFPTPKSKVKLTKLELKNDNSVDKLDSGTQEQTGLALSWLIKNCEVPQSVDVALQSIAGATNRMSPLPLLKCQAPLQILRRLASSTLYRRPDTKSDAVEALYLRALSFLQTSANQTPGHQTNAGTEHQALIWDLQVEMEKKLAVLIEKGDFDPTRSNLDALRLGSTVASTSQKILKTELQNAEIKKILDSITKLLKLHLECNDTLHDAALLSLAHAATLILLLAPISITSREHKSDSVSANSFCVENGPEFAGDREEERDFIGALATIMLCFHLGSHDRYSKLVTGLSTTCKSLFNVWIVQLQTGQPYDMNWYETALRELVAEYAQGRMTLEWVEDTTTPGIDLPTQMYNSAGFISRLETDFLTKYQTHSTAQAQPGEQDAPICPEDRVWSTFYALGAIHCLGAAVTPSLALYVSVVEVMCRTASSSPLFACGAQMLSRCPFPTLSEELATALEQRDLVPLLTTTSTSHNRTKRYFARGQLWLLLSLYIYAGDTASGRDKLKVQLDKCRRADEESEEGRHQNLGEQLWMSFSDSVIQELGIWTHKINLCVWEFRQHAVPAFLRDRLSDVPPEHQGLSSFTAWPRRATDPPTTEPRRVKEVMDLVEEHADATDLTTGGEGATGDSDHLQSAGLVADTGEAEQQGEDDAGRTTSSQDIGAATQGPPAGDGKSLADVNSQEEVGEVQGGGNRGVEAVGDERKVADEGDAAEATNGPHSEGEEGQSDDAAHDGGKEGHRVIDMGGLENESNRPTSSS